MGATRAGAWTGAGVRSVPAAGLQGVRAGAGWVAMGVALAWRYRADTGR